jgi:C1q domain
MANTRISGNSLVINSTGTDSSIPVGTVSVQGNITSGNILTTGIMSSTGNATLGNITALGNIQGSNLKTVGLISATGTITGGNLTVNSGFISGGNIISAGPISAGGTITAPSLNITNGLTLPSVSTTGNVTGGNILTGGNMSTTGNNISGGNVAGLNLSTLSANGVINGGSLSVYGNITGATVKAAAFLNTNGSPYQGPGGPAFIATQTVPQNLVYSPVVVQQMPLVYNSVSKNIGNGYNSSTGVFTAPTAGFYQVTGTIGVNPNGYLSYLGAGVVGLYYNGTPYASGAFIQPRTNPVTNTLFIDASTVTTEIYLNVNDIIQCVGVYQTNAPTGAWNTGTNLVPARFSAVWLRS